MASIVIKVIESYIFFGGGGGVSYSFDIINYYIYLYYINIRYVICFRTEKSGLTI